MAVPFAIVGLATLAIAWTVAAFVWLANPSASLNRRAAVVLALDGVIPGAWYGFRKLATDLPDAAAAHSIGQVAFVAVIFAYLLFLARIDVPITRWLRSRAVTFALMVALLATPIVLAVSPAPLVGQVSYDDRLGWMFDDPPVIQASFMFSIATLIFGLVVAISALTRARPGPAQRALAYLLAFALRDSVFVLMLSWSLFVAELPNIVSHVGIPLVTAAFALLVGYGALRSQLFDINAKLRWSVKRGTVATTFVAVFFVVGEIAQNFLAGSLGYVVGGAAAGLLLFAIAPLQRVAERVAQSVVPSGRPLAQLNPEESAALFREQATLAWEDGTLGRAERAMLDKLRERLGLTHEHAARLEGEILSNPARSV